MKEVNKAFDEKMQKTKTDVVMSDFASVRAGPCKRRRS